MHVVLGKWSSGNDRGHINFVLIHQIILVQFRVYEKVSGSTTVLMMFRQIDYYRDESSAWYHCQFI